jgi:hypothetical protein
MSWEHIDFQTPNGLLRQLEKALAYFGESKGGHPPFDMMLMFNILALLQTQS